MACKFILIKNKQGYDISDIVQRCTWSGRKNNPARSVQLEMLDDPKLGENNRPNIDVEEGQHLIFLEDGNELFRGIIMKQTRNQDNKLTIIAYDNAIYLSNNSDSFKYSKKTVTNIFLDVCTRFGITRGSVAAVTYKIPTLVNANTTIYDILCCALSKTYQATGERYYVISQKGQLHLLRRMEHITKLVLETGREGSDYGNMTSYTYTKDITSVKTRLKLISQNGKTVAQWRDMDLEEKIGIMQDVQTPDDSLSKSKLKTQVISMLNELKKPIQSLDITAVGISEVYSGIAVYIYIPEIGISRTFYVDADTHTWDGDTHTMRLTLNYASDLESIADNGLIDITSAEGSSATKAAKQSIKDAASALKVKTAAEKKVITAGKKAESAADNAEANLKKAQKAKKATDATKFAKLVQTKAQEARTRLSEAKTALSDAKAVMNLAQSDISAKATSAIYQAEAAVRRADQAETDALKYL